MLVRKGRNQPFHPQLRIESTGYAPMGQWTATFFRPNVSCGLEAVSQMSASQAIQYYLSELKRTGHVAVER
jgi:hypothetical protein